MQWWEMKRYVTMVFKVLSLKQAASSSTDNLLQTRITVPHTKPIESETLGDAVSHLCFNKSSG